MPQKIEGGMLADIKSLLKSISETFFKFVDKLSDYGIEITKEMKLDDDGGVRLLCKYKSNDFGMEIHPIVDDKKQQTGKVNLTINFKNKDIKLESVNDYDIEKQVTKALEDILKIDFSKSSENKSQATNSAKTLKVTLQKVTSATEDCIELTAITANYDASAALSTLDSVLDNDEFLSALPEDATCYEIVDNGDEYAVSTTEEFGVYDTCTSIVGMAMKIWCNLSVIHWDAKGDDFIDLHRLTDNFRYRLMEEIDFFGELSVELSGKSANPGLYTSYDGTPPITDDMCEGFTAEFGFELVSRLIEDYIRVLDTFYVNFSHDVQSRIDEEIRMWKKDLNYFINRRLKS